MSGTILDTAAQIVGATASDAGVLLAVNWINQRYAELISRTRMKQNRRYGTLAAPAEITSLTVNATQGSTAITFSAIPTIGGSNVSLAGWQIRTNVTWYFITAHTSGQTTATIEVAYSDATGTALTAAIVKRYLLITDPNVRWVSSVVHPRRRKRLRYKPYETLNSQYPSRTLVGAFPWCWTEAPKYIGTNDVGTLLGGTTGQKAIEIYPPSNIVETYGYVYWNIPSSFAATDTLPNEIDEWVLREGVLIDVYRYKSEQWADKGNAEMSGLYANKEARQRTVWEEALQKAAVTDALYHNQIPIEVSSFSDSGEYSGDIETAHEWVVAGWTQ